MRGLSKKVELTFRIKPLSEAELIEKHAVRVEDPHQFILVCLRCGTRWHPVIRGYVGLSAAYYKCPQGCFPKPRS